MRAVCPPSTPAGVQPAAQHRPGRVGRWVHDQHKEAERAGGLKTKTFKKRSSKKGTTRTTEHPEQGQSARKLLIKRISKESEIQLFFSQCIHE